MKGLEYYVETLKICIVKERLNSMKSKVSIFGGSINGDAQGTIFGINQSDYGIEPTSTGNRNAHGLASKKTCGMSQAMMGKNR